MVGYLTINLLQNFPLLTKKDISQRHLPVETPPVFAKLKNETKLNPNKTTLHSSTPISSKPPQSQIEIKQQTTAPIITTTNTSVQPQVTKDSSRTVVKAENERKPKLLVDEYHTVRVPDPVDGPFTVAKHFWELTNKNSRKIFDLVPPQFLPNFKNPCFWQEYHAKGPDPYADSPYAPPIGKTIQYDPWGHFAYYRKARERFTSHLKTSKGGKLERIRCLPYFYLISTPKSGTTTLWNQLNKHEEVNMRIGIKENAWWNFMRNGLQGEHHWVYHLGKFSLVWSTCCLISF